MSDAHTHAHVRIHIDREAYESPSPTTGKAIYQLGDIAHDEELFREIGGDAEDPVIPRDDTEVVLTADDHFYSQKTFRLIINLEEVFVVKKKQSFDEIAKLAFPVPPPGQQIEYHISYRKGPPANPKGRMVEGQTVKVKDGMSFDVTASDQS
jgi:hypothetical protein